MGQNSLYFQSFLKKRCYKIVNHDIYDGYINLLLAKQVCDAHDVQNHEMQPSCRFVTNVLEDDIYGLPYIIAL
jgi:hypothetical protein